MKKLGITLLACLLLCSCATKTKVKNEGGVVYEIFVASFNDSNGDQIGDLNGITEKLDYIEDLGVSTIWLMPIHPSHTYHKYNVEDYYAIDEDYGTMEDFEKLINEAKKRNIGIIIDLVLNHSSSKHNWFVEASADMQKGTCDENSKCDWYHFSDTAQAGYTKIKEGLYYESVFDSTMPDLNLNNPEVKEEIKNIVSFYLEKGVAGFRLDASLHYFASDTIKNVEFLDWFNTIVKDINPEAYIVSEVWSDVTLVEKYYDSGLDSFFDFSLSDSTGRIVSAINKESGANLAKTMAERVEMIHSKNELSTNAVFLSNHDQGRSGAFFTTDERRQLAASVYLLAPGVPYLYYGEEIGMRGSGKDENKRLAMLWGEGDNCASPLNADYTNQIDTSVKTQLNDDTSLLNHYKSVIEARNKNVVLIHGNAVAIDLEDNALYALRVYDEERDIIIIHNFAEEEKTFKLEDNYVLQTSFSTQNEFKDYSGLIKGYSTIILERVQS